MSRIRTGPAVVVLVLLITGATGMVVAKWGGRGGGRLIHDYAAPTDVPRLHFVGDSAGDPRLVRDFDQAGDALYLLDMMDSRVLVLRRSGGHWTPAFGFARAGGGPGELVRPTSIAVAERGGRQVVVVADQMRLHYFTLDGSYIETVAPEIPCLLGQPHIAAGGRGLMLSGQCLRADTIAGELFWLGPDGNVTHVAGEPLYTMGGGGNALSVPRVLYTPGDGHGLFGSGADNCLTRVNTAQDPPSTTKVCDIVTSSYAFEADPELEAQVAAMAAARPAMAGAFALPDRHPVLTQRIASPAGDLIVRAISMDSVAFRRIGSEKDLAIAPLNGLIGCRAAGCLWMTQDSAPAVMFVPVSRLLSGAGQ